MSQDSGMSSDASDISCTDSGGRTDSSKKYLLAPADMSTIGRYLRTRLFILCDVKPQQRFVMEHLDIFCRCRWLKPLFELIAFMGTEEGWAVLFVMLLCANRFSAVLVASYTLIWAFIICNIIKTYFCLPRPAGGSRIVHFELCYDWSFPSNHATTCTAIYYTWQHFFPIYRHAIVCVFFICLSRLYFQVHHITDLSVGYILGRVISFLVVATFEWFKANSILFLILIAVAVILVYPCIEPTDTALTDTMHAFGIFIGFLNVSSQWMETDQSYISFETFFVRLMASAISVMVMKITLDVLTTAVSRALGVLFGLRHFSSSKIRRFERKQGLRVSKHYAPDMAVPKFKDDISILLTKPLHESSPYYWKDMGVDIDVPERFVNGYILAKLTATVVLYIPQYLELIPSIL